MNILKGRVLHLFTAAWFLFFTGAAWAQWELDAAQSSINFVSIKNDSVAEIHSFSSLRGFIGSDGKARVTIELDSVETLIDIRNERMREMLFKTVEFPAATITAVVEPDVLSALNESGGIAINLPLTISLHGIEKSLTAPVIVTTAKGGAIRVFTPRPVIVNAADYNLEAGVAALQAVAGLQAISRAVPVTLQLVFKSAEG